MIYSFLAFLAFLSPLIFFHELGHFLLARFFGVRVEIFSLGFGKRLFAFKWGETDYRFSLIPLGGYVKMYGENLLEKEAVPMDQRKYAYNHKSKWARFWIVFAGPLFNFILAFALYFFLVMKGEEVREFKVAELNEETLMYKSGFRTGDIIKKINGEFFYSQEDMVFLDEQINLFEVLRNNKTLTFEVSEKPEKLLEDYVYNSGYLIDPLFYNTKGEKYFLSHSESKTASEGLSYQELLPLIGEKVYLYKNDETSNPLVINIPSGSDILNVLREKGYFRNDVLIEEVISATPAAKAGIIGKTLFSTIDNKEILSFQDLRKALKESKGSEVEVKYVDFNGNSYTKRLIPNEIKHGDQVHYTMGVRSGLAVHQGKKIFIEPQSFGKSVKSAFKRTKIAFIKTYRVLKDMVFGSADVWNNLGGPIAIANVASSSLQISLEFFLRFMAVMSINLGIMNLLPVPVLDGGHILFLFFELINGGTLSRSKMEFAQKVGLSFLLLLMGFVIFNDISRFLF